MSDNEIFLTCLVSGEFLEFTISEIIEQSIEVKQVSDSIWVRDGEIISDLTPAIAELSFEEISKFLKDVKHLYDSPIFKMMTEYMLDDYQKIIPTTINNQWINILSNLTEEGIEDILNEKH